MMKEYFLTEICQPKQWKTISTNNLIDEGYPVYGANGIIGFYKDYTHEKETLLITCRGATCGELNICQPFSYVNGNAMALDNLNSEKVNLKYLYYFFKKRGFQDVISGSAQPQITRTNLEKVKVPLPDLDIQNRIVKLLDKAQFLIDKRSAQITVLSSLKESLFLEMFGDPINNPKGFEVQKLENYISFLTSGSRGWAKYFSPSGELFITIKNVKNGELNLGNSTYVKAPKTKESDRTKVQEGDLLVSITADLGRTAVVDKEVAKRGAYINQHLSLIRLMDNCNPYYISSYLESAAGRRQFESLNQVGVKAGLNFAAIKSLDIIVPPLELQNNFEQKAQEIKRSREKLEKGKEYLELLLSSLMQRAFNGELISN